VQITLPAVPYVEGVSCCRTCRCRDSGLEALRRLRTICAEASVLLTSGYHEVEATREFARLGLAGFIQKPDQIDSLLTEVRRCLR
jgi:DNA-binding NtrC family response regulator